ncbi:MAG TPA: DUF2339 domain-containing protein, partial [Bradyrhizobium sp.]
MFFDFFSLMVAIVALVVARNAFNEIGLLKARLGTLESATTQTRPAIVPPPLAPQLEPEQLTPEPSPGIVAEPPAAAPELEPVEASAEAPDSSSAGSAAPPPLPQPVATPSFEERIGTRWVVWVGGLTLALGGFFMVRYSIEAGLIGPGVRVMLGGAFALALLAAGEWLRRKQDDTAIDMLPIAN